MISCYVEQPCKLHPVHVAPIVYQCANLYLLHLLACKIQEYGHLRALAFIDGNIRYPAYLRSTNQIRNVIAESGNLNPFKLSQVEVEQSPDLNTTPPLANNVSNSANLESKHVLPGNVQHSPQFKALETTGVP